ncbi:hypothetical protein T05_4761 [Trichinella murrelli]|uniref:Uncharacterized protein n=1 Tax=Trichinella murrelli TaxID=144512 RepID=A0A0V0TMY2_9BILA|nr:hypothetical protein T05_4761 [Trichinella murrelli]
MSVFSLVTLRTGRWLRCVAAVVEVDLLYYHRKEQLTLADSASLPELDLLPSLFGLIRNPYRYGNTRQRWIKSDNCQPFMNFKRSSLMKRFVDVSYVFLCELLRKKKSLGLPKNAVKAFEVSKQAIVNATLLSHALDNKALSLEVDVSDFAADAVFNYI